MRPSDLARLLLLATLWGGSFLLFRIVVPELGAIVTTEVRVAIAGIALVGWHAVARRRFEWRAHVQPMAVVGVFNSALPFALFAFAAKTLPAGYLAILNATAPLSGALVARFWLGEALGPKRLVGLACGIAGVATLVRLGPVTVDAALLAAVGACLVASASYGWVGNYTRRLSAVPPASMATGSQIAAAIVLLPWIGVEPVHAMPTARAMVAVAILGLASTAVAYLLYFRLIRDIGATRALSVTFLVPLTAIAWGWLVLGERPTPSVVAGAALILVATGSTLRPAAASPGSRRIPSAVS